MQWNLVKRKLPKRYDRVICLYMNGKVDMQVYYGKWSFEHALYGTCVYWMPVPELPKYFTPQKEKFIWKNAYNVVSDGCHRRKVG